MAYSGITQKVNPPASKMKFDIGPQFSFPLNTSFKETHSFGFGASSRSAYYFTNEISAGIRINYDYFIGKKYTTYGVEDRHYNITWTSLLANLQYDFDKNIFLGGDAGIGLLSIKGSSNSTFTTSLYAGKAIKLKKSSVGIALFWTQVRQSTNRDEAAGLRATYRFN